MSGGTGIAGAMNYVPMAQQREDATTCFICRGPLKAMGYGTRILTGIVFSCSEPCHTQLGALPSWADLAAENKRLTAAASLERAATRLVLAMAPSFQGGHSKTGSEVAELLGVPFPLRVSSLETRARELGFDPADLWPWRSA